MQQISPAQLKEWMATGKELFLLDIRESWERATFNIGGVHIPMDELFARRQELPAHIPIILYCEKGIRSTIAIQRLEGHGLSNLYNLSGGMTAWKATSAHQ